MDRRVFLQSAGAGVGAAVLSEAAQVKPVERKLRLRQSVCRWCYSKIPLEDLCAASEADGPRSVDLLAPDDFPTIKKLRPDPHHDQRRHHDSATGWQSEVEPCEARSRRCTRTSSPRPRTKLAERDCFSGNRRGMRTRKGMENCAEGIKEVVGRGREDRTSCSSWSCSTARSTTRTTCATTPPWGVELVKRVGSPQLQAAVRHLPHADHGRRRDPHDPGQQRVHRPLPHRRQSRAARDRRDAGAELQGDCEGRGRSRFQGYFAHEFIPLRDPLTSLAEATDLLDV